MWRPRHLHSLLQAPQAGADWWDSHFRGSVNGFIHQWLTSNIAHSASQIFFRWGKTLFYKSLKGGSGANGMRPQNNSQKKLLGGKVVSNMWLEAEEGNPCWSPLWHRNKNGAKYRLNVFWCDLNLAQLSFSDLEISELNLQHVFLYLCILFILVYVICESVCPDTCVCHLHVYNQLGVDFIRKYLYKSGYIWSQLYKQGKI